MEKLALGWTLPSLRLTHEGLSRNYVSYGSRLSSVVFALQTSLRDGSIPPTKASTESDDYNLCGMTSRVAREASSASVHISNAQEISCGKLHF